MGEHTPGPWLIYIDAEAGFHDVQSGDGARAGRAAQDRMADLLAALEWIQDNAALDDEGARIVNDAIARAKENAE